MSDLIDRQAAIDSLVRIATEKFNFSDEYNQYLAGLMDAEMEIKSLPSEEPKRKKGKWIIDPITDEAVCSVCNADMPVMFDDWRYRNCATKYCPSCGTQMEGEDNG